VTIGDVKYFIIYMPLLAHEGYQEIIANANAAGAQDYDPASQYTRESFKCELYFIAKGFCLKNNRLRD